MRVENLEGAQLDYWVAKADGRQVIEINQDGCFIEIYTRKNNPRIRYSPSTDWSQGGPIIEQYGIDTIVVVEPIFSDGQKNVERVWSAERDGWSGYWGPTPLIAAMRCYVCSKLGGGSSR